MVIIEFSDENLISNNFIGITFNHIKVFRKNKRTHRYYGPARIWNGNKDWWYNGKLYGRSNDKYNQKQFLKNVNKSWLL